jgi:hypothetical protein
MIYQKYRSLLSSVTSKAQQLIQNLPVAQQTFHVEWNFVFDSYNSQR